MDAAGSCESSYIVSASLDKSVIYWDVSTGLPVRRLRGHAGGVTCIRFNEESSIVVSGSKDNMVACWDIRTRKLDAIQTMREAKDCITALVVSEHRIISSSLDGSVRQYDIRAGELVCDTIGVPITHLVQTRDGQCLLAACSDGTIRLIDNDSGEMLSEYKGHRVDDYHIECGIISSDTKIISGSAEGSAIVWDLLEGTEVRSFQPKRVSELPPLESDSESDGDMNLNCAILNDSFLLTPSKCADDMESTDRHPMVHDKSTSEKDSVPKSRIKLEDKLLSAVTTNGDIKPAKRQPLVERTQLATRTVNGSSPTKTARSQDSGIATASNDGIDELCNSEIDKTARSQRVGSRSPIQTDVEPEKMHIDKSHHQFVTPREKFPLGVSRGTGSRMITSTTMRKSRSTLENEFKSQKILFATPVVMARPPVGCLANDSINLSLLGTPGRPKEAQPLSPIREQQKMAKRSTNQLFGGQDGANKISPPLAAETAAVAGSSGDSEKGAGFDMKENAQIPEAQPKGRPIVINGKEYQMLKKLGSGGSSSVFLAKQVATGLECAVKLVNLNGDANLIEGYLNETKLLAKLQTNENVIALYDYAHIPEANQLFLVMENGECDLHRILQGYSKDIPLYTLMSIWYQMVQCVHYIHENGVIHLDLKPANFLMIRGRLKLIDFGIASNISFDSTSIMKFSQAGTFNYISPEALIDTSSEMSPAGSQPRIKMSKKSDIWSLGCILYLLLYKRTPFAHIKNIYTKVNTITNPNTVIDYPPLASYYPPMLLDVLKRCLRYDAKSRASTAELLKYPYDMIIPLNK
uniref:Uncharacterized protein n=1 Tax=Anopheles atroparvus TaxID=41427 RepID=A0A182IU96_ANOAO